MPDSGHLQEEEAYYANRHHYSKHDPALPLYTAEDGERALNLFQAVKPNHPETIFKNCTVTFLPAGHIIGASIVKIIYDNETIIFSGDLGRMHDAVMRAPTFVESTDYLIVESTYGDRLHEHEDPETSLEKIINETTKRGGTILVPAFAVGRAQALLYYLAHLKKMKKIPNVPIFLDSPMAINATGIFCAHCDEHHLSHDECSLLGVITTYVNTVDESKKLNELKMPAIIISASGMLTGGRVLHHFSRLATDEKNTILLTGYQAGGTRGALLLNGEKMIRVFGQEIEVRAQIASLMSLSAHADAGEILMWLSHFKHPPKKTFITHGEPQAAVSASGLRFG